MLKPVGFIVAMAWALGGGAHLVEAAHSVHIVVDGSFDDWSAVPVAFTDPSGDHGTSTVDIQSVWIANDDDYVYLRFGIGVLRNLSSGRLAIYFDVDQSAGTGWRIGNIGSDLLLRFPNGPVYEQTAWAYLAQALGHAAVSLVAAPTFASTQFELRLRRGVTLPRSGLSLFSGPGFTVIFEGQDSGGSPRDYAPNGPVGHRCTLTSDVLPRLAPVALDKADPAYVRVITWNVLDDGLFARPAPFNRILAALEPDVLCLQEIWEHSGAEVAARLNAILPLGGGSSWKTYKAGQDNVVAARWPLSMQRGDTIPETGRGQAMALVGLPNETYSVDLYVMSAHYKCCGSLGTTEDAQRQAHSDANVNWLRDLRTPGGSITLPSRTPFLLGGDLNMVGGPQPLDTLLTGNIIDNATFGADSPPDWDGTPITAVRALHSAARDASTWRNDESTMLPGRLDYLLYPDSAMQMVKTFVLNTGEMSSEDLATHGLLAGDTPSASDHLPVVADFNLGPPVIAGDFDGDLDVDEADLDHLLACVSASRVPQTDPFCADARLDGDADVDLDDVAIFQRCLSGEDVPGDPECAG